MTAADRRFMEECFRLARKGAGRVSPNPLVGAVIVRGGRVVARGYHRAFGGPHAEIECLRRARGDLHAATLYVNLEPCAHHGKTPPCTDAILAAGIRRVVVGMPDPNPLVAGRGVRRLRRAGVRVTTGVLEAEARELNRMFSRHIAARRPYVNVKIAQSLDGYIAPRDGIPRWISDGPSRRLVRQWRSEYDAVLVGAGTILADDPRLTTRLEGRRDPAAVILDGQFRTPERAKVFRARRRVILCVSSRVAAKKVRKAVRLERKGVTILQFAGRSGMLSLAAVLHALYREGIGSVLVEGGGEVFAEFLRSGLIDELNVFVAPLLLGEGVPVVSGARRKGRVWHPARAEVRRVGRDMLIQGFAE